MLSEDGVSLNSKKKIIYINVIFASFFYEESLMLFSSIL
jgi:Zn-dependent M28 family amino/carboxypeptidase